MGLCKNKESPSKEQRQIGMHGKAQKALCPAYISDARQPRSVQTLPTGAHLNHLQGSPAFMWCFASLFHKQAMPLQLLLLLEVSSLWKRVNRGLAKHRRRGRCVDDTDSEGDQADPGNDDEVQH